MKKRVERSGFQSNVLRVAMVYTASLALAALASCTRAEPDPSKVHPAGTTTAGIQALRSPNPGASAGGSGAVGPAGSDGLATAPMDGSTTSVAPATADLSTGTSSGTTDDSAPASDGSKMGNAAASGAVVPPRKGAPAGNNGPHLPPGATAITH